MLIRILSVLLLTITSCYCVINIEKYLKICERNSLEVNECLVDAVQDALKVMIDGNKELGVPPLDPFLQKELRVEYNNNQIKAKMVMSDIYVIGLSTSTVRDVRLKADEDKFHLEIDMFTPKVIIKGQYEGGGSYNSLKLLATGEFNNTMTDLVYTWKVDGAPEVIDGVTYIRVSSFYMRPDVGTMKTTLTNNNPDSKELTELGVRITNENWRLLYKEMLPFAQSNWNKIGTRICNKIFLKVPYDVLFPIKS
ncbi:circadian clock-controlled protein daywake-like [Leptidea sinapis]|uniref:circadian clock-controlled protein daywake-like n=1 Tax=Leptidea sinapis TaxID=189913 RepID=UPI0021C2A608|nr:circadian clock-controlled protein daywake-like [Leptidea sinapis]